MPTPDPPNNPPPFSIVFKGWCAKRIPFGLDVFIPNLRAEYQATRRGWKFYSLIALVSVALTAWFMAKQFLAPLKEDFAKSERRRIDAEQKLAPFWAAGERYYSSLPSTERLTSLLNVMTNSAEDVRELRRLQSRTANLKVFMVGEGAGWSNIQGPFQSNIIVYVPLFADATNAGLHFVLTNSGAIPAESIQVTFSCSTGQVCFARQWDDLGTVGTELGSRQFRRQVDVLYPDWRYNYSSITFSVPAFMPYLSSTAQLLVNAKNAPEVYLPFELFFFRSKTNAQPFLSTNRSIWHDLQ